MSLRVGTIGRWHFGRFRRWDAAFDGYAVPVTGATAARSAAQICGADLEATYAEVVEAPGGARHRRTLNV